MPKHNRATARLAAARRLCLQIALVLLGCGAAPRLAATAGVLHHFAFDHILSPQNTNNAFAIRVTACDASGNIVVGFNGKGTLSGLNAANPVPISVASDVPFSAGVWSTPVATTAPCNAFTLSCTSGAITGTSNVVRIDPPAVRVISVGNTDLAYSATTGLLYVSTSSGTLIPIDPTTGALGAPASVASDAISRMAVSRDGSQLHVIHSANRKITRIPTATLAPAQTFAPGPGEETTPDLIAVPGQATTIAALISGSYDGVPNTIAIFDQGVRRPETVTMPKGIASIAAGDLPGRIYAVDRNSSTHQLYRTQVTPSGITLSDKRPAMLRDQALISGGSLVANSFGGSFIDGESTRCLATLSRTGLACLDEAHARAFVLWYDTFGDPAQYYLSAYDTATFEEIGRLPVTGVDGYPERLQRWGTDGVAFRTNSQVVLLRTGFLPAANSADLAVQVVASASTFDQPMNYGIRVLNRGPVAAGNTVLNHVLPAGSTYFDTTTSQGVTTRENDTITVTIGSLAVGAEVIANIRVMPGASGIQTSVSTVFASTPDPSTSNNRTETKAFATEADALGLRFAGFAANGLGSDGENLFATFSGDAPFHANSVTKLAPALLAPLQSIDVGHNPEVIQLTDDHTHAHLGLNGAFAMQAVDLIAKIAGTPVSFDVDATNGAQTVFELAPLPNSSTSVAVVRKQAINNGSSLAIYDDTTPRPLTVIGVGDLHVVQGSENNRLHVIADTYSPDFTTYSITPQGLSLLTQTPGLLHEVWGPGQYKAMGDIIVSTITGEVIDTKTQTLIASLKTRGAVATDKDNHRVYFVDNKYAATITAYETETWTSVASFPLGDINGQAKELVRWGRHGLALVTYRGDIFTLDSPLLVPDPPLRVIMPAETTEGAGTLAGAGRVEIVYPAETPLVVTLTSSMPGVLSIPASVTIPQGAKSATFNVTVADNNHINGTRLVTVTPAATGAFVVRPATIAVHDDESASISLTVPSSIVEGTGATSGVGTVTLSAAAGEPVAVNLASSDLTEAVVPSTVVIPAGQTSATFPIGTPDDDLLDGDQNVTITASMPRWNSVSKPMIVADNDARSLTLTLDPQVTELGSATGTVHVQGKTMAPLAIALTSSAVATLACPSEVTIPAGETSCTFALNSVNNMEPNSSPAVTITATAPAFSPATANIVVVDDDPYSVVWTNITGAQKAGVGFATEVFFKTMEGNPAGDFGGAVTIKVVGENGDADFTEQQIALYPYTASRTSTIAIKTAGRQTRLVATCPNGTTGQSAPFAVNPAATVGFRWDPIASPRQAGVPFPATIRSADTYGNPTTDFTGTAKLAAVRNASAITLEDPTPWPTITAGGYGASTWRTTTLLHPSELGGPTTMRSLALDILTPPTIAMNGFTIRLKHSALTDFTYSPQWDSTGWTIVYQGTPVIAETGWNTFRFTTPFVYDGVSSVLVDISFNNPTAEYSGFGDLRGNYTPTVRTLCMPTINIPAGDPLTWTAAAPVDYIRPSLRICSGENATATPATTGAFTAGVWTGQLTIAEAGANTVLSANNGTMSGSSAPFAVFGALAEPSIKPEPVWSAGDTNTLAWPAVVGANRYQIQRATSATFADEINGGWNAGTNFTFTGLANATKYFYRVRAAISDAGQQSTGPWSAVVFSTQDTTTPTISVTPASLATTSSFNITGTASDSSGLSTVTVDGAAAITSDAFAHWSRTVALQPGMNTLVVAATDLAYPAQSSDLTVRILHIPSAGDPNGDADSDGLSDLMEYAFGLDPTVADSDGSTAASIQTNSADLRQYLVVSYRQRHGTDGLTFHIESSVDLETWSEVTDAEELYTMPTADGNAYTVTVRLQPAISAATPRRFVRLKVTTP